MPLPFKKRERVRPGHPPGRAGQSPCGPPGWCAKSRRPAAPAQATQHRCPHHSQHLRRRQCADVSSLGIAELLQNLRGRHFRKAGQPHKCLKLGFKGLVTSHSEQGPRAPEININSACNLAFLNCNCWARKRLFSNAHCLMERGPTSARCFEPSGL